MALLPAFQLTRPAAAQIAATGVACEKDAYAYSEVGHTRGEPPAGYLFDEQEAVVGHGREDFLRAKQAVARFDMFDLGWVIPPDVGPPEVNKVVPFASRQLGLWMVHACRVIYIDDATDHYGFAYGTLATHAFAGEEQFRVLHNAHTDEVVFRIRKFSRPASWLVALGGPISALLQRQFSAHGIARVARAVQDKS